MGLGGSTPSPGSLDLLVPLLLFRGLALSAQGPELVLEIGADLLEPGYSFGRLSEVAVADDGRIFALDAMDNSVRSYSADGRFLVEFGGGGQGPGEFMNAVGLEVRGDVVEIHDALLNRLTQFSLDGALQNTITLDSRLHTADFSRLSGGWVVGKTLSQVDSRIRADSVLQAVVALNVEGKGADTLALGTAGTGVWWEEGEVTVYHVLPTPFGDQLNWVRVSDSVVLIVDGYAGEARLWNFTNSGLDEREGSPLDLQPTRRTEDDLARALADHLAGRAPRRAGGVKVAGPTLWSAVAHLIRDDRGNLWLGRPQREPGAGAIWHVVSANFEPLGDVGFPGGFQLQAVLGDRAYGIGKGDFDVTLLQVYRIPEASAWARGASPGTRTGPDLEPPVIPLRCP